MDLHVLHPLLQNWRGGLAGVTVFILFWCVLFGVAFMIAFGNENPAMHAILHAVGNILIIANPLWGIPAAYFLGAFLFWR